MWVSAVRIGNFGDCEDRCRPVFLRVGEYQGLLDFPKIKRPSELLLHCLKESDRGGLNGGVPFSLAVCLHPELRQLLFHPGNVREQSVLRVKELLGEQLPQSGRQTFQLCRKLCRGR